VGSYLAHGLEICPKAHENPRAFSCISGPIYLESSIQCPYGVGLHHHFKEKMSLEEVHHHRRPWIRAWRKKEMNEGRGREEHEILCSKRALKYEV